VSDQVSTLKKSSSSHPSDPANKSGLGIATASFKWNEVEEKEDGKDKDKEPSSRADSPTSDASTTVSITVQDPSETESLLREDRDHKFELKDINIMFPEGELTLITGPTASGKTALLVILILFCAIDR
jgi:ABC-type uncharacterized transport system fused permease/ATPase subunit